MLKINSCNSLQPTTKLWIDLLHSLQK